MQAGLHVGGAPQAPNEVFPVMLPIDVEISAVEATAVAAVPTNTATAMSAATVVRFNWTHFRQLCGSIGPTFGRLEGRVFRLHEFDDAQVDFSPVHLGA